MGRTYSGILAIIAFVTSALRGLLTGAAIESNVLNSIVALVLFAGIGTVIGAFAEIIVRDSVRALLKAELESTDN